MAYISNSYKGTTLGGSVSPFLNPASRLLTGAPSNSFYKKPTTASTDRSKLTVTGQQNALSQFSPQQPSQAWKDAMSTMKIGEDGKISPIDTSTKTSSYGPVQSSTTSTSTLPYNGNNGTQQNQNQGLQSLMTGLQSLATGLEAYKNNQTKGLLTPPKVKKDDSSQFSKFASGLMDASQPSKTQRDYLRKLEQQSKKGEEAANRAAQISDMYGNEIARVGNLGAGAVAGAKSTGTDVVGRGNAAIAAESASNRISALGAAQAAALQGTGQQLTAAEQGITGLTSALTGANTQQQLSQQALQAGGQLLTPSPAAYGQTVFDPFTGQFSGGNLDPQQQAQNLAQAVINGGATGMTYDQALASMGYAGPAGVNFLNNAITSLGGSPLQLQAQNAAQQANIATQGTAGTEIARQGLQEATQSYINTTTAAEFAHQQAGAVINILAQTGLNNVSSADYNKALNNLKGRFSDVNFSALNTALTEAQVAYTNLLSTGGGTPSGREAQAINTLNINQSAAAINASIQELENAVARRLQAQYGALQQYNQNLGTGQTYGGGNQPQSGGSASVQIQARDGNTYGFYQDANGNWVVAQ